MPNSPHYSLVLPLWNRLTRRANLFFRNWNLIARLSINRETAKAAIIPGTANTTKLSCIPNEEASKIPPNIGPTMPPNTTNS